MSLHTGVLPAHQQSRDDVDCTAHRGGAEAESTFGWVMEPVSPWGFWSHPAGVRTHGWADGEKPTSVWGVQLQCSWHRYASPPAPPPNIITNVIICLYWILRFSVAMAMMSFIQLAIIYINYSQFWGKKDSLDLEVSPIYLLLRCLRQREISGGAGHLITKSTV